MKLSDIFKIDFRHLSFYVYVVIIEWSNLLPFFNIIYDLKQSSDGRNEIWFEQSGSRNIETKTATLKCYICDLNIPKYYQKIDLTIISFLISKNSVKVIGRDRIVDIYKNRI